MSADPRGLVNAAVQLLPALHEAGHAVVAIALGFPVKFVRLRSSGRGVTAVENPHTETPSWSEIGPHVAWSMAGYLCERRLLRINRRDALASAFGDLVQLERLSAACHPTGSWAEVRRLRRDWIRVAHRLIRRYQAAIIELAAALVLADYKKIGVRKLTALAKKHGINSFTPQP